MGNGDAARLSNIKQPGRPKTTLRDEIKPLLGGSWVTPRLTVSQVEIKLAVTLDGLFCKNALQITGVYIELN